MTPAQDIARFIQAAGLGTVAGTADFSIFVGTEPVKPTNVVTVYDMPGGDIDTDELDVIKADIQIKVRALNYLEGYAWLSDIRDALHAVLSQTVGSRMYCGVTVTADVSSLGTDDNDRQIFVATFNAIFMEQ